MHVGNRDQPDTIKNYTGVNSCTGGISDSASSSITRLASTLQQGMYPLICTTIFLEYNLYHY